MSRPWLITPRGQRVSMIAGTAISLLALLPLAQQIELEASRSIMPVPSPGQVEYCLLENCKELSGIALTDEIKILETEFGTEVSIRVINTGRQVGQREIWAELRAPSGERIESLRGLLELSAKGPQYIEFFFTGTKRELEENELFLGN